MLSNCFGSSIFNVETPYAVSRQATKPFATLRGSSIMFLPIGFWVFVEQYPFVSF